MHVVEILLPLRDNHGEVLPEEKFTWLRQILTDEFGGLTAFTRSPADGFWKANDKAVRKDDIVVFEVMTEQLRPSWWAELRRKLEDSFRQEEIVIRAHAIERL
jgi:hypothetical protein